MDILLGTIKTVDNLKPIRKPVSERVKIRTKKIRSLYRAGYSMDEICKMESHSKTTVFFAIKGRSSNTGEIKNNNKK